MTLDTLQSLRAKEIAYRDRLESVVNRQANVTEQIDHLAIVVARLHGGPYTVAQSRRLEIIAGEVMRRAGGTRHLEAVK